MRPKPRQLAPVVLVAATPILLLCAIWNWLALLPLAAYLLLIALGASYGAVKHKSPCILLAMIALPCMHFAWGAGFLRRFLFR
jgi:succinoglycan biosynthesis protein ExoA